MSPQDRAEIGHILGICGGQFHVAISARLLSLSLPRLDALSELIEVTASDPIGRARAAFSDHGQPPSRNWAVDPNTYTSVADVSVISRFIVIDSPESLHVVDDHESKIT